MTRVISCSSSARSTRRELGDVALDELDPVDVVAEHELEAMARVAEVVADDVVAVVEHAARDPGAEAAEDAGDEDSLSHGVVSWSRSSGAPLEQVGGSTTGFVSVPISGTWISTTWPGSRVKSSGGTRPVPVRSTLPGGTGLSRMSQPTRSVNVRCIRAVDVSPAKSTAPVGVADRQRDLERRIPVLGHVDRRPDRAGGGEHLGLGQVEGLAPSMSRDETSLPIV